MDPPKFPVREQGPETGLVHLSKYYSKTCMDENSGRAPSDVHPISQQKRHPTKSALKNGGAENFDGSWVLRPRSMVSLFIRQLTGKKQAWARLSLGFRRHAEIYAFVSEIVIEISANSLRRETGIE